jgi:hypothetical protein
MLGFILPSSYTGNNHGNSYNPNNDNQPFIRYHRQILKSSDSYSFSDFSHKLSSGDPLLAQNYPALWPICPTMFWTTHVSEFQCIGSYYKFTRNHHSSLTHYDQNIFKIAMTNGCYNLIYHLHWKLMKGEEPCYYSC